MSSITLRVFLSTSRGLDQKSAWGLALRQLLQDGHVLVGFSGGDLPSDLQLGQTVTMFPSDVQSSIDSIRPLSREAVGEYERYRDSAKFYESHALVTQMMSRLDSTGTFRALEREVFAREIYLEIFSALVESKPNFGIFDVTPHDSFSYAAMAILEWKRVPLLMFQPSLVGPQVFARTSLTEPLSVRISDDFVKQERQIFATIHELSDEFVDRLARGAGTPKMDAQKAKEQLVTTRSSRLSAVLQTFKKLVAIPGSDSFALTGHGAVAPMLRRGLSIFLERSLRFTLRDRIDALPSLKRAPVNTRFALFAMHYEPERSSLPEGYPFTSQLDAIIAIRALLPSDVTLFVKEHFSQKAAALRGFVGRSPEFFRVVGGLPGVIVLGTPSNTTDFMAKAECVMTFTGKVGIEAALLGTQVMYLGQPWWSALPGAVGYHEVDNYDEVLANPRTSGRIVRAWLSEQIRSSLIPGLASVDPERYEERIAALPDGFERVEAEGIISAIRARIGRIAT